MDDPAGENNLRHAMAGVCEDPDCEIHHPDVGIQEGTVSLTNLAFYIAGASQMASLVASDVEEAIEENWRENFKYYHEEAFEVVKQYKGRTLETDLLEDR